MTIYLGADLAGATGIAYGRAETMPHAEVRTAPTTGADLGAYGRFWWIVWRSVLKGLAERLHPGEKIVVCYESPVLIEKRTDPQTGRVMGGNSIETTRKLQSLGVILETACLLFAEEHNIVIEVFECHSATMKVVLAGHGHASKPDMVEAARRAGVRLPAGPEAHNAADGFAAWLVALRAHEPKVFAGWIFQIRGDA
jgi:hypothetical protein